MEPDEADVLGTRRTDRDRLLVWAARGAWVLLVVTASGFGAAFDDRSRAVQIVGTSGLWVGWAIGLFALLLPNVATLVVARLVVPMAPAVSVAAMIAAGDDASALTAAGGLALAAIASALVLTGEVGQVFVQGSAYGAELRLPLRAPAPVTIVVVVLWALLTAGLVSGPLLLASRAWIPGIVVSVAATGLLVLLLPRLLRLADRWLVLVPAGLVVHDPLVLADTFMMTAAKVRSVELALADTEAADVTGGALGHAVEITLADFDSLVLAADRDNPGGRALHVRSILVSPTRPGRTVSEWARR